jgi:acetyl-CoA synthetase
LANQSDVCEPEWVEAEHPLFLLYTSGSTGKPKGVQHSTGGYLLHAIMTMKWTFDIKPNDVFWCTADIGWVTGHTYITYGPLACGATEVVFEGVPTYPGCRPFLEDDPGPQGFHLLHRTDCHPFADQGGRQPTRPSIRRATTCLRCASSVRSASRSTRRPGQWYYENVGGGRCPIVDTFWQTETGGHMITPLPGATPLVPGSCTLPFPGIQFAVVDETGADLPWGQGGILVCKKPWPSMIRTIWNDDERFVKSYYPADFQGKYYLAGDGAIRDKDTGYFTITGRIDDVLNVSGHRMGTMEIESALVANPLVAEAAVVGRPDDLTGEAIVAFVVLKGQRPTGTTPSASSRNCQTGWARRSVRSPSRRTSVSATTCRRPVPARSCVVCCVVWPRARS